MTLKSSQDLVSGLFFLAIGLFALWIAWGFRWGRRNGWAPARFRAYSAGR